MEEETKLTPEEPQNDNAEVQEDNTEEIVDTGSEE